jgi:hypothetical protein
MTVRRMYAGEISKHAKFLQWIICNKIPSRGSRFTVYDNSQKIKNLNLNYYIPDTVPTIYMKYPNNTEMFEQKNLNLKFVNFTQTRQDVWTMKIWIDAVNHRMDIHPKYNMGWNTIQNVLDWNQSVMKIFWIPLLSMLFCVHLKNENNLNSRLYAVNVYLNIVSICRKNKGQTKFSLKSSYRIGDSLKTCTELLSVWSCKSRMQN